MELFLNKINPGSGFFPPGYKLITSGTFPRLKTYYQRLKEVF